MGFWACEVFSDPVKLYEVVLVHTVSIKMRQTAKWDTFTYHCWRALERNDLDEIQEPHGRKSEPSPHVKFWFGLIIVVAEVGHLYGALLKMFFLS